MSSRRLIALTFAVPGAAHAQGIVLSQSKIHHNNGARTNVNSAG